MVKCWGICFSLCCALCSPPQRTRGGSNTAATIKKETQSSWGQNKAEGTANITFYCYLLCVQDKDLSQTRSRPQPHKLALTLNSSLKSLPSSAERIRYSSSSESRGMGKYLLDGEGDLGRRTTVCSPAVKGIYGGQTANVSQQRTLQALIAPAKTSLMAIKISYFCGVHDRNDFLSHKHAAAAAARGCPNSEFGLSLYLFIFCLKWKFIWLPTCWGS